MTHPRANKTVWLHNLLIGCCGLSGFLVNKKRTTQIKIVLHTTMPHTLSRRSTENETLIQEALDGLARGKYKSAYQAAKELGVPIASVYHRKRGRISRTRAYEEQQLLTEVEEKALVW
jgi:hypothetical protein